MELQHAANKLVQWHRTDRQTDGQAYLFFSLQAQVPICGWVMVIPWCWGWLLRCSNYFLYGDITSIRLVSIRPRERYDPLKWGERCPFFDWNHNNHVLKLCYISRLIFGMFVTNGSFLSRPTDCRKISCEKFAIQGINRPSPELNLYFRTLRIYKWYWLLWTDKDFLITFLSMLNIYVSY